MQTSTHKSPHLALFANPVSIARHPMFWKGRRYYDLAPSRELHQTYKNHLISNETYTERFFEEIRARNIAPRKVVADLGMDATLLCWCDPGKFCHRRLVASWLEKHLGIEVPEYVPEGI